MDRMDLQNAMNNNNNNLNQNNLNSNKQMKIE